VSSDQHGHRDHIYAVARVALASLASTAGIGLVGGSQQVRAEGRAQTRDIASVSHGLRFSLTLHQGDFPRDALVRMRLEITNLSPGTVYVQGQCPYPGPAMGVQVASGSGRLTYPPPFNLLFYPPCPGAGPRSGIPLPSGAKIVNQPYAILRGTILRPFVTIQASGVRFGKVLGKPIRVELGAVQRPKLLLHTSPAYTYADLVPRPGAKGPLLYMETTYCKGELLGTAGANLHWTRVRKRRIFPECPSDTGHWRAVAGWLGQSIVMIDYVSPATGS
jgi:hypothetical protein